MDAEECPSCCWIILSPTVIRGLDQLLCVVDGVVIAISVQIVGPFDRD